MPGQSFYSPASFIKRPISINPFASQRASLAAARDPFAWFDEDFRDALGEAWANNDMAAGYQSAMNPQAPQARSFGSRTIQGTPSTPQSPWVKPAAPSQYGEVLGHPIEGFRRRPGSLF